MHLQFLYEPWLQTPSNAVLATKDVKNGDVIFSIPLDLVLACGPGFDAQLGTNMDEITPLAVKLLSERALQQQSPYHPYIQVSSSWQWQRLL